MIAEPEASVRRWRPGVAAKLHYYVYLLIDPRNEKPFYVGKGRGDRCFAHVEEARKTEKDSSRDYPKLKTIREIERTGQVRIELLRWGLEGPEGEQTAYAIEAAVIDLLRLDLDISEHQGRLVARAGSRQKRSTSRSEPPRQTSTLGTDSCWCESLASSGSVWMRRRSTWQRGSGGGSAQSG